MKALRSVLRFLGYATAVAAAGATIAGGLFLATLPSSATHAGGNCDAAPGWCDCQFQDDADPYWDRLEPIQRR